MKSTPIPAIERVKAQADSLAYKQRGFAFERVMLGLIAAAKAAGKPTPPAPVIGSPNKFFRRLAGLRGADLRN